LVNIGSNHIGFWILDFGFWIAEKYSNFCFRNRKVCIKKLRNSD